MPVDSEVTGIGLHMAARDGNAKMVQAVLARKSPLVNIEERDLLGDTALLKAARYGHLEVRCSVSCGRCYETAPGDNGGCAMLYGTVLP